MMRIPIIAGNWKMHKTVAQSLEFVDEILPLTAEIKGVKVVLCPPFTALYSMGQRLQGTHIEMGAQDVFWADEGAYTGEISPPMLKDTGSKYAIVGHSERRHQLKETDEDVNQKVKSLLQAGLWPILCVGETLEQRQAGNARQVVKEQLEEGLKDVDTTGTDLVIAYEPVWAIGTGVNASSEDAQDMIGFIRQELAGKFSQEMAERVRILYGGSVKANNIEEFMSQPDIDGALIGGASLQADSLAEIARRAEGIVNG